MDPEQAKYRELFEALEKEAAEAKAARRPGKVSSRVVGAGCAAIIAVYGVGYVRTQSASEHFTKQLAVRRVASLAPPVVDVIPARNDASYSRAEHLTGTDGNPAARILEAGRDSAAIKPPAHADFASVEPKPSVPAATASPVVVPAAAGPSGSAPPAAATPAFAPAPVIEPQYQMSAPPKPADPAPAATSVAQWKDGTYTGWGYSRHGNIEAQVVIESGRIASATISQCRTRYSCSVIDRLPPQVAQRQSAEVDYVSGATQSADAFYGAVVEALGKAK